MHYSVSCSFCLRSVRSLSPPSFFHVHMQNAWFPSKSTPLTFSCLNSTTSYPLFLPSLARLPFHLPSDVAHLSCPPFFINVFLLSAALFVHLLTPCYHLASTCCPFSVLVSCPHVFHTFPFLPPLFLSISFLYPLPSSNSSLSFHPSFVVLCMICYVMPAPTPVLLPSHQCQPNSLDAYYDAYLLQLPISFVSFPHSH